MALDRWQQQLCDLLAAVRLKHEQFDLASAACQVLLKPWPKKSQKSEPDKKDAPDKNGNDQQLQPHEEAQLQPHEEAELKMVNDVLKRAQKTRVKPTSKKLKEHASLEDDPVSSRSGKKSWEICDSEHQESHQESTLKGEAQCSKSKLASVIKTSDNSIKNSNKSQSEQSTKTVVNKQQQRSSQPARQSRDQRSHSVSKYHSSVSSAAEPAQAGDLQRPKSLESRGSSRPSSQPKSARGNFKPAHTAAPFKTDPRLHFPKRPMRSNIRPVKQQPAGKSQNYAGDRNYANKVIPPISLEKGQPPPSASHLQKDCVLQDACDTGSGSGGGEPVLQANDRLSSDHGEPLNSDMSTLTVESHDTAQEVAGQRSGVGAEAPALEASSSAPVETQEAKLFSLLSDGSSINIPPKVRRAFAKNQQLRKKVSQRDNASKAKSEGSHMAEKFAEKLQQLFDPEEELLYRQKALECLHTHQQLLLLLTQLKLDHITETSSPRDILHAKTLAEFVLSSFSELSEEVSVLTKVQFPDTPTVMQPSHTQAGHPFLWLPASLQGENLSLAHKLQYTSKTDLSQYMNVLLRLQSLQCQHHLLAILVNDILPWLQQQDCNIKDFGAIFRGLFALLTSNGGRFWSRIKDPEDSSEGGQRRRKQTEERKTLEGRRIGPVSEDSQRVTGSPA